MDHESAFYYYYYFTITVKLRSAKVIHRCTQYDRIIQLLCYQRFEQRFVIQSVQLSFIREILERQTIVIGFVKMESSTHMHIDTHLTKKMAVHYFHYHHCSHFLAVTFDFTTFFIQAYKGHTIFSQLDCLYFLNYISLPTLVQ